MSLLERLKSFLGLERPSEPAQEQPVAVTVEREGGVTSDTANDAVSRDEPDEPELSTTEVEPDDTTEAVDAEPEPQAEPEPEPEPEPSVSGDGVDDAVVDDTPVTDISGIGPAYAERLADADITNVSDLAAADAADLASRVDVSETRLAGWIEAARDRSDGE